jgi:hypothetical protein
VLTNLLPGFRELRTPLAVGWTWLVAVWLLTWNAIPPRNHATGIELRLYQLSASLGTAKVLVIGAFVAYLVGSLLEFSSLPGIPRSAKAAKSLEIWAINKLEMDHDPPPYVIAVSPTLSEVAYVLATDRDALATQLLAKNREVYNLYDRLEESSSFRFNMAPAVGALTFGVAAAFPRERLYVAALGFAVLVALLWRSLIQRNRADIALVESIKAGLTNSQTVDAWWTAPLDKVFSVTSRVEPSDEGDNNEAVSVRNEWLLKQAKDNPSAVNEEVLEALNIHPNRVARMTFMIDYPPAPTPRWWRLFGYRESLVRKFRPLDRTIGLP